MDHYQGLTGSTRRALSPARKWLVETFQKLNFGRLEQLEVRDGEPIDSPTLEIIREIKFGGENGSRPELQTGDFLLKSQVIEMLEHFDRVRDCHIEVLEIKHGLPFRMLVREAPAQV